MIDIARIDQIYKEGKEAAREGMPFSACPYPFHGEHARIWEKGWMGVPLYEIAQEAA